MVFPCETYYISEIDIGMPLDPSTRIRSLGMTHTDILHKT